MNTFCPHCNQKYDVEPEMVGETADCEVCGKQFIVAAPATASVKQSQRPAQEKTGKSKGLMLMVGALLLLVAALGVTVVVLLTRTQTPGGVSEKTRKAPAKASTAPSSAESVKLSQERERERLAREDADRQATTRKAQQQAEDEKKRALQNAIANAVQLRLAKEDEKNASLLQYLLKWEIDEFAKHKEMKQAPVTFKAEFRGHTSRPAENIIGGIYDFDDPCRVVGSKYDFDNSALVLVLRSDHRFNDIAMETVSELGVKGLAKIGSYSMLPSARVDISLVIPMAPERAQPIRQKEENGTLRVTLVFQVDEYKVEKESVWGEKKHEYFQLDVTPRVLNVSFD